MMATAPVHFNSISGQHRILTPVRPISSNIRLVRDQSLPDAPLLALKKVSTSSQSELDLLLRDAAAWRRVCASNALNVLYLHDVAVIRDQHTALFLTEYCPATVTTRSERPALRILAGMAAGLSAVLAHSEQPAHANLSLSHILLDENAVPKLAGWGLTRANRLARRKFTQRDDVKALAGILYEMLYATRYDPSQPSLPSEPRISSATAGLLREALFVPVKDVPELTVFRYDIAAARKLVPVCTPALAPVLKSRRGDLLIQDLNSVRPSIIPQNTPVSTHTALVPSAPTIMTHHHPLSQNGLPPLERPQNANGLVVSTAVLAPEPSDAQLDPLVRRITSAELLPIQANDIEQVVEACTASDEAIAEVFRVLFRCPISKNPIVAYKAIVLIHHLISEGPAKVTARALTHDEFLKWIESSWSRARLQSRTGKAHVYSYCFAVGEIEWYVSALRKRMETQAKFAKVFSTHWLVRVDGLPSIANSHRPTYSFVLEIIEKVSALIRKVMASRDPVSVVKRSAIPILVREVAKTYQVACWLYATSGVTEKPELEPELDVAHNATRLALAAVKAVPEIASTCPPSTLLDLSEEPPRNFDVAALTSALKKKIKKKKKTNIVEEKNIGIANGRSETEQGSGGDDYHENGEIVTTKAMGARRSSSDDSDRNVVKEPRQPSKATNEVETVPANVDWRDNEDDVPEPRNTGHRPTKLGNHANTRFNGAVTVQDTTGRLEQNVGGLETGIDMKERTRIAFRNRRNKATSNSVSHQGRKLNSTNHLRAEHSEDSDSDDSNSGTAAKYYETSPTAGVTARAKGSKKKTRKSKAVESDSDTDSSLEDKSAKLRSKTKKKTKSRSKSEIASAADLDSGEDAEPDEKSRTHTRPPRKQRSDEKKIPFDKKPPKPKAPLRRKSDLNTAADNKGVEGSQKALDAAASGRKTPKMDPKFEVGPNEVQFGPQIGSGGFGVVFKAKFRNETVAVKKIHAHALSNAASVAEFQSEVAVLCTLQHPNILRFMGACTKPPRLMIITEFMARGTLFDVLHQSQMQVSWPMRKKFALDTCQGMGYLHASRLLHRDLKSSNLMLDKDFNCKVGDFGLTRISGGAAAVQMTGQCGTFQYMAVEVLANKPYSEKADVFSFGILLWEMVARKLPYFGMQPMQVGIAVLNGLRPTVPSKCPLPLAKLMRTCWDSDPEKRPSFVQLVKALESMPE